MALPAGLGGQGGAAHYCAQELPFSVVRMPQEGWPGAAFLRWNRLSMDTQVARWKRALVAFPGRALACPHSLAFLNLSLLSPFV